ncbi:MAG: protein phosphatase [Synechococcaceae bacterium WB9_2_112]|nr:protein phosphatase [Synechococcaceae bacterium WB9_2_112]
MATDPSPAALQATLFEFAITELVRRHRGSFQPLWSAESWAKLLIWLALNCGCSGDEAGLRAFAEALGPLLSARLRRLFFERELDDLELRLMADPAEPQVLILAQAPEPARLQPERVHQALERCGLSERVAGPEAWQQLDGLVRIPWR